MNKQFDVKNLLRNSNLIKLMLGTMFNKEELLLLLFQRKQVIDPGADDEENGSDISFKADFTAKMSSRVEQERAFARNKIEEILAAYEGKELNAWDKKLIHGIYHYG